MGKTKEQHEKGITEAIIKNKVMFIDHIFNYYTDLKRAQFYNLSLEKSDTIKEAISNNRQKAVDYMINKWIASEQPTLQIGAMKVLSEEDIRRRLNQQDVSHSGTTTQIIVQSEKDKEALEDNY